MSSYHEFLYGKVITTRNGGVCNINWQIGKNDYGYCNLGPSRRTESRVVLRNIFKNGFKNRLINKPKSIY